MLETLSRLARSVLTPVATATKWVSQVSPVDLGLVTTGVLVLIAVSPLFQPGLPDVADAPIHLFRTAEWVRSWQAGIPIPRWSPNLAYGYGYPLFVFAPPLPYALAGVLHLLGFSLTTAIKMLSIACFAIAGLGMYALARRHFGPGPAVLAAAAYLFAPFLLREAYLYGGNYPQLLAIALFPAVLWAFDRLMDGGRAADLLLAAGLYGALILSHNFHALVFTPLLILYLLVTARLRALEQSWRRLLQAGLAMILGLGWTAFFWVPALVERRLTRAQEEIYVAVSPFYLRFLDLGELIAPPLPLDAAAANPALPFTLGTVIVALAVLGALAAVLRPKRRWPALLFLLALLLIVFMLSPGSEWIWANVPLLATAEYPWRLMGLAALCCAWLVGTGLGLWPPGRWPGLALAVALVAIVLGSAAYLYPPKPSVIYGPAGTPSLADQVRFERATGTIGSTTLGEFLPLWVREVPRTSPLVPDLLAGRPVEKLDRAALPAGVKAERVDHTPHSDRYRFVAGQPFTARFFTFYFPGWQATMDGQPVELDVTEPDGLIEVLLPAGQHELVLHFAETPLRTIADAISLLSLGAIAMMAIMALRRSVARASRGEHRSTAPSPLFSVPRSPLLALLAVLVLLLAKEIVVDPHTTWFRRRSLPQQVMGASHSVRANLADKVLLLGYDLDRDAIRAGQQVHLTLYWQALQPLKEDYNVFVHLDAPPEGTTLLAADKTPPGDPQAQIDIPTSHWETDSYVRDEYRFTVPADLPPVRYTLRVGLYDPAGSAGLGEAVALQEIQVLPARSTRPSQLPNPAQFRLGEQIELLGYELESEPAPTLTLYWRAKEKVEQDYIVFVHLVDQDGVLLEQRDGPPLGGMYPTSSWWPEQIITDRREIPLPAETDRLLVGMYDLASMQRLPAYRADGQRLPNDAIPLAVGP